jgi:hypothetical protein
VRRPRVTPARVAIATLAVAVAIQLIPVRRDNPPVQAEVEAPLRVQQIIERACYDCHSNRTRWPWYSHVAPVSWLVAHDVHEGRDEVNFSEWPTFDFEKQDDIFKGIAKQVGRKKMPLPNYLALHPEARLTEDDRQALVRWARME